MKKTSIKKKNTHYVLKISVGRFRVFKNFKLFVQSQVGMELSFCAKHNG